MRLLEHVWLGRIAYGEAWALQRRLAAARARGEISDTLLLVEHPPVYTMGRSGSPDHLPFGVDHLRARGAEYREVDRGGSVTFHGPGQLVAYPVLGIADVFPLGGNEGLGDVLAHLRALEEALLGTVAAYGVAAARRAPYTGIWVGDAKLAAIGVKLAGGVTTHGAALNVSTDLDWFAHVIPCGISGAGVTSLLALGVSPLPVVAEAAGVFAQRYAAVIGAELCHPRGATKALLAEAQPSLPGRPPVSLGHPAVADATMLG